jgi:hypothetical protein
LLLVNGHAVGHIEYRGFDFCWEYGLFHALPAFELYGEPLRLLEEAMMAYDTADEDPEKSDADREALQNLWFDLMEEVDRIVSVDACNGSRRRVRDFKVRNGWYEFKYL